MKRSKTTTKTWKQIFVACVCILGLLGSQVIHAKGARMGRAPAMRQMAKKPSSLASNAQATQSKTQSAHKTKSAQKEKATAKNPGVMGRFGGLLGGLMAGLGLAALASYLGVGEGLLGMLVLGMALVFGFGVLKRFWFRRNPHKARSSRSLL